MLSDLNFFLRFFITRAKLVWSKVRKEIIAKEVLLQIFAKLEPQSLNKEFSGLCFCKGNYHDKTVFQGTINNMMTRARE